MFVPQQLNLQPPPSNRGPSTNPILTTPPPRTKQASSPKPPSASSTRSSRISADRIYPADSRVNHKTVTSLDRTNDPVIFAEHFRTGFAGRPSWTLLADQPWLGDQPSMPVKNERTIPFDPPIFSSPNRGLPTTQPVTDPNPEPKATLLAVASEPTAPAP